MPDSSSATALLFLREEELRQGFELLVSAYRDLEADADALLAEQGLKSGHARALHVIGRSRQPTVTAVQAALGITLQSVGRLLSELTSQGLVAQRPGPQDRRQRLLSLTETGAALEKRLWDKRRQRIARAYRDSGPQAVDGFRRVLAALAESGTAVAPATLREERRL
jgi:DNA-binding MarR family transcriptional regulator